MAKPMEYYKLDLVEHKSQLVPTSVKSNLINMRSLVHKMHLFEFLLYQLDIEFSCIVISETWFSDEEYFPKYFKRAILYFAAHGLRAAVVEFVSICLISWRLVRRSPGWLVRRL